MSTTELAELIDSKFRELREGSIVTGTIQEIPKCSTDTESYHNNKDNHNS